MTSFCLLLRPSGAAGFQMRPQRPFPRPRLSPLDGVIFDAPNVVSFLTTQRRYQDSNLMN